MRRVSWVVVVCVVALACFSCGGTDEDARPRDRAADVGSRTPAPSDAASPGPDPSQAVTFPALSAEKIRQHPDAKSSSDGDLPATASGAAARIWSVCLDECTRATEHTPGELQTALEVSRDDFATGSLYPLDLSENISHAVDDWYLIDVHAGAMLVDSRGHRRLLQSGASVPGMDIAGPLVYSRRGLAYIDMPARKLHVIEGRATGTGRERLTPGSGGRLGSWKTPR